MLENIGFLVLGFVLLIKGADYFVDSSAKIARKLGVSDIIIGLTLTALGTSLPELASAVSAIIQNEPGLIIGNIVGSNIANIGLIGGISALIHKFGVSKRIYLRDGYMLIFSALAFFVFAYDGIIGLLEACSLLFLYLLYIMFLIQTRSSKLRNYKFHDFLNYFFNFGYITTIRSGLMRKAEKTNSKESKKVKELFRRGLLADGLVGIAAIIAIVYGAKYLVQESIWLANLIGISSSLVGLSVIAIGTSLPELSVVISAARKGLGGIIIGNIIGSNIANVLLVGGISAIFKPLVVSKMSILHTIPIMGFFSLALVIGISKSYPLGKNEGRIALACYILFLVYAFSSGLV